jgi:large subunit ribosomal protein L9
MEVILIERVAKLGQIGEVVRVRSGFARNFLLPQGKALRATKENRERFESIRAELEAKNADKKSGADVVAKSLDGQSFVLIRQAGETGHLYGSVSARDIMQALSAKEFEVSRQQIVLNMPIKTIGLHKLPVELHPEVEVTITVNVARSPDEAARQAKGEDLRVARSDEEEARAEAGLAAEKFFERGEDGEPSRERKPRRENRAKAGGDKADAEADAKPAAAKAARGQKQASPAAEAADAKPAKRPRKEKPAKE